MPLTLPDSLPPSVAAGNRGALAHLAGDLDGAEAAYREALDLDPQNATALANLAYLLAATARHAEAAECYRQALALDPTRAQFWANAGVTELWLGRVDSGVDALWRAVRLDPGLAHAWDALGRVGAAQGDWAGAEDAWRSALAADEDDEDHWVSLAAAVAAQGGERVGEAAAILRAACVEFPDSARVHTQLAAMCLVRQDYGSASEALGRALALAPGDPAARFHAGLLSLACGAPDDAAAHLEFVAATPNRHRDEAAALLARLADGAADDPGGQSQ